MRMIQAKDLIIGDIIAFRGERLKVSQLPQPVQGRSDLMITAQTYRDTLRIGADPDYEFRVVGGGREFGND